MKDFVTQGLLQDSCYISFSGRAFNRLCTHAFGDKQIEVRLLYSGKVPGVTLGYDPFQYWVLLRKHVLVCYCARTTATGIGTHHSSRKVFEGHCA